MIERVCIIDGNNLYNRGFHIVKTQQESPLLFCIKMFFNLQYNFNGAKFIFTFDTCKSKRRLELYPEYKGNRKSNMTEEEHQVYIENLNAFIQAIKLAGYTVLEGDGYEADDYISVLAYMLKRNYKVTIVTMDKDIFQLIDENVKVYEPIKQITINMDNFENFVKIPLRYFLTYKCLRGDDSDNIKGISGIGEITATDFIKQYGGFDNMVNSIKVKDKKSSKEEKILNGQDIYHRNMELMDLRLCYADDNLKQLIKSKIRINEYDRDKLFDVLSEYSIENLIDKLINPSCLKKQ